MVTLQTRQLGVNYELSGSHQCKPVTYQLVHTTTKLSPKFRASTYTNHWAFAKVMCLHLTLAFLPTIVPDQEFELQIWGLLIGVSHGDLHGYMTGFREWVSMATCIAGFRECFSMATCIWPPMGNHGCVTSFFLYFHVGDLHGYMDL